MLNLVAQLCSAVVYANNWSIYHNDIKPANIMVTPKGKIVLIDFGTARIAGETLTAKSSRSTLDYAAPEQFTDKPSDYSDVFSVGVVTYEMLTWCHPFAGSPMKQAMGDYVEAGSVDKLPIHRQRWQKVFEKVFQEDPERRYHSTAHFYSDLIDAVDVPRDKSRAKHNHPIHPVSLMNPPKRESPEFRISAKKLSLVDDNEGLRMLKWESLINSIEHEIGSKRGSTK